MQHINWLLCLRNAIRGKNLMSINKHKHQSINACAAIFVLLFLFSRCDHNIYILIVDRLFKFILIAVIISPDFARIYQSSFGEFGMKVMFLFIIPAAFYGGTDIKIGHSTFRTILKKMRCFAHLHIS